MIKLKYMGDGRMKFLKELYEMRMSRGFWNYFRSKLNKFLAKQDTRNDELNFCVPDVVIYDKIAKVIYFIKTRLREYYKIENGKCRLV